MKKLTYMAAMMALALGITLSGCESKTKNKADDVAEAKQEVAEAERDGDTKEEVMDKQADLDSARKDFKKAWDKDRDDMRKEINRELEDIDEKTASFERDMKTAAGEAKTKLTTGVATLKKERATLTGLLKELDQVTAASWDKTKKAIETVKDGVDDRVDALDKK
ncbi:hypothetical protein J2I47_24300 [Fibrella sp. HMF5335]|uniref:Uncharacterized protein n=1 Tax=Fibrella rubiginis TaxID=2817060 RepID=A0A939GJX3_9BACT|nr:hypothetical protein [Fibrella rubiginis]MBO0939691.1 hypothetical protein [Fibrella rubiginis]